MLLRELLETQSITGSRGDLDRPVGGLAYDSRVVKRGDTFFALAGHAVDGHDFVPQAVKHGATAVVVERDVQVPPEATCVQVENTRRAMALAAAVFYGHPSRRLVLLGITGTNGKTTVTYLLESIFEFAGETCGVLGTISNRYGSRTRASSLTTPESLEIEAMMSEMVESGVTCVAMEVSSHALDMDRVGGLDFDGAVFTNLSRDHLDYHGDIESYFRSKARLFTEHLPGSRKSKRFAVINHDDPRGRILASEAGAAGVEVLTYGRSPASDIHPIRYDSDLAGLRGEIQLPDRILAFHARLIGEVNLANVLAAAGVAWALGLSTQATHDGIAALESVPGRLERIPNELGITVLVDYAHTPDALAKVLGALRLLTRRNLVTVFGCGGDRDTGKRALMGEIAAIESDLLVVTSDNPRTEDPHRIIDEIERGITRVGIVKRKPSQVAAGLRGAYWIEPDRHAAIRLGLRLAQSGDVLLVAGKGHEDYQIVGHEKRHFDDRAVLRREIEQYG